MLHAAVVEHILFANSGVTIWNSLLFACQEISCHISLGAVDFHLAPVFPLLQHGDFGTAAEGVDNRAVTVRRFPEVQPDALLNVHSGAGGGRLLLLVSFGGSI